MSRNVLWAEAGEKVSMQARNDYGQSFNIIINMIKCSPDPPTPDRSLKYTDEEKNASHNIIHA